MFWEEFDIFRYLAHCIVIEKIGGCCMYLSVKNKTDCIGPRCHLSEPRLKLLTAQWFIYRAHSGGGGWDVFFPSGLGEWKGGGGGDNSAVHTTNAVRGAQTDKTSAKKLMAWTQNSA